MIDEKKLDEWSEGLVCLIPGKYAESSLTCHEHSLRLCDCQHLELIRLARLGLWARLYAVEALEMGAFHHAACPWHRGMDCCCSNDKVKKALEKLPECRETSK